MGSAKWRKNYGDFLAEMFGIDFLANLLIFNLKINHLGRRKIS